MNKGKEILNGTFWTTLSTATTAVVQILRISILAHFLTKADFGIVAVLTLILGLTHTFTDLGFASAIMHKRDISCKDFSSLYWIQLLVFSLIYLVVIVFSIPIAEYFKEPAIISLLPLSMLDLVLQGIGRLYDTLLQRGFRFKLLAYRNIISALVSLVFAVVLAVMGYGVYSLVFSTLAHSFILNLWNFFQGQGHIKLQIYCNIRSVWPLIKIGIYQTGTQILDYLSSKLDILIIGRLLGMENLGVYNLAKELIIRTLQLVNTIANRVILPYFSLIQEDIQAMRDNYCRMIKFISIPNFLIYSLIGVFSSPIVLLLYGETYTEVAPVLSILALWGLVVSVGNPAGNVVIAKGRTDISLRYTIVRVAIYLPLIYLLSSLGLYAISLGQVGLALFSLWLSWYMQLYGIIELKLRAYVKTFGGSLCLAASVIVLAILVNSTKLSVMISSVACAGIFSVYAVGWYLLNHKDLKYLISLRLAKS